MGIETVAQHEADPARYDVHRNRRNDHINGRTGDEHLLQPGHTVCPDLNGTLQPGSWQASIHDLDFCAGDMPCDPTDGDFPEMPGSDHPKTPVAISVGALFLVIMHGIW
ncbi:hypothetical protein JCM12296A_34600 [Desulfosarcina cetonica]